MGFRDLLAQNVLLRRLTGRGMTYDLALSMAGVRLGERVAQVGLGDGGLFVALAGKVGYTGRACGVDPQATAVERARRGAERAGVLVELERAPVTALPLDGDSIDLLVVMAVGSAVAPTPDVLGEALRVLRPGGRCLVIVPASRGGLGAVAATGAASPAADDLVARLQQCGFRASRQLAQRDGLTFLEATKTA